MSSRREILEAGAIVATTSLRMPLAQAANQSHSPLVESVGLFVAEAMAADSVEAGRVAADLGVHVVFAEALDGAGLELALRDLWSQRPARVTGLTTRATLGMAQRIAEQYGPAQTHESPAEAAGLIHWIVDTRQR